jgi:type IV pilus assembly protein PilP
MDALNRSLCALIAIGLSGGCGSNPPSGARPGRPGPVAATDAPEPAEVRSVPQPAPDLYVYTPAGRRDPFRSPYALTPGGDDDDRERGPLERFDLDQLRLEGCVWGLARPLALIVTPDGSSHHVRAGARIGKHGGRVERVLADRVVVAETYRNANHARITRRTILPLRPGGLADR